MGLCLREYVCALVISGSVVNGHILHASHKAGAGSSGQVLGTAELLSRAVSVEGWPKRRPQVTLSAGREP